MYRNYRRRTRIPERVYTSNKPGNRNHVNNEPILDEYNRTNMNDIPIDGEYETCFHLIAQYNFDHRERQMQQRTKLDWFRLNTETNILENSNKKFIIINVRRGNIPGIENRFNGIIATLKRVN